VNFGGLNLLLTAIVDGAQERREADKEHLIQMKNQEYMKARETLMEVCQAMDADNNGVLSLDELISGYENNQVFFEMMHLLDIEQHDMCAVFTALDVDKSGSITYTEFVDQIYKIKMQESRAMLVMLRLAVQQLLVASEKHMRMQSDELRTSMSTYAHVKSLEEKHLPLQMQPLPSLTERKHSTQLCSCEARAGVTTSWASSGDLDAVMISNLLHANPTDDKPRKPTVLQSVHSSI